MSRRYKQRPLAEHERAIAEHERKLAERERDAALEELSRLRRALAGKPSEG